MPQGMPTLHCRPQYTLGCSANFPHVKALVGVWVNIQDFLDAVKKGPTVQRYPSESVLPRYIVKQKKNVPKVMIVKR